ncbi:NmrA family transcriptional regulator [Kribbella antibiotica]|uniref:NmrA family transcriptional regulator n=1 Tax=Kribbella antibiotica TaxID=190195 RepID=A0A4R4ZXW1_9ACTN|nr:NAD(P)H-binding protein [Kribbella antibiotica]TDD62012.1 NmrA family transcriptional regulator [Kribbella antibiotica]
MIMVTGASGQLASLTLAQLAERGIRAVGGTRTPADGQRLLDFDDPATLDLAGITTLVLVSAGYAEDDLVIARHQAVLEAAVRDGVGHVIYTSLTGAGDHLAFALAHRSTEQLIKTSGLAWTILRNGLYAELFGALISWSSDGLESPFGSGRLAAVARTDLAAVTATIAQAPSAHANTTYDLVGDPISADDVATRLGVTHRAVGLTEYRSRLLSDASLLPFQPAMLTSIATSIRHGFLNTASPDLASLLDRPPTDPITVAANTAHALRPVSLR